MTPCLPNYVEADVDVALIKDSKTESDVKPSRNMSGMKVSIGVGSGILSPDRPIQETQDSSLLISSL